MNQANKWSLRIFSARLIVWTVADESTPALHGQHPWILRVKYPRILVVRPRIPCVWYPRIPCGYYEARWSPRGIASTLADGRACGPEAAARESGQRQRPCGQNGASFVRGNAHILAGVVVFLQGSTRPSVPIGRCSQCRWIPWDLEGTCTRFMFRFLEKFKKERKR